MWSSTGRSNGWFEHNDLESHDEWVFEAHDRESQAPQEAVGREAVSPTKTGWLSWLDGSAAAASGSPDPSRKFMSRDSDASAPPLPEETVSEVVSRDRSRQYGYSRDRDLAESFPEHTTQRRDGSRGMQSRDGSRGLLQTITSGLPSWMGGAAFQHDLDDSVPIQSPSRLDPYDMEPQSPADLEASQMVPNESSRFGMEGGLFDEVHPERMLGPSLSRPPASSEAVTMRDALEEDEIPPLPMRKDTVDRFLEQFDRKEVAAAVRAASNDLGEEPPMPPPAAPPSAEEPETTYDHEFVVLIDREHGTPLGINMGHDLKIASFQDAGAVINYNGMTQDEELKILIGDKIVGVNGSRGDWKELKKHLKQDAFLELVVLRKKEIVKDASPQGKQQSPRSPQSGPIWVAAPQSVPEPDLTADSTAEAQAEKVEPAFAADEDGQTDQAPPLLEGIDEYATAEAGLAEASDPPFDDIAIQVEDTPLPAPEPPVYEEDPNATLLEKIVGRSKWYAARCMFACSTTFRSDQRPVDAAWLKGCQDDELEDLHGACGCVGFASQRCLSKGPTLCVFFGMITMFAIIGGGMAGMPPSIELDFSTFLKTDVNTSAMNDVFRYALQQKWTRRRLEEIDYDDRAFEDVRETKFLDGSDELNQGRSLAGSHLYKHQDLSFAYEVPEGEDIFAHAGTIVAFENELRQSEAWQKMCNMTDSVDKMLCMPGISVSNYISPTLEVAGRDIIPQTMTFDARGAEALPANVTRMLLMQPARADIAQILLPKAFLNDPNQKLTMIRSVYRFKWYCCTSLDTKAEQTKVLDEMKVIWNDFIDKTAFPLIQKYTKAVEGKGFSIFYRGNDISSKEIWSTLLNDLMFALVSALFVLFYLVWHTGSIMLGSVGLIIIMSSILMSYVFTAVLTGTTKLSLASCLSVFIVIGLGSDVVFVYSDFWRASKTKRRGYPSRLTWTLMHAGKASLATSVTTAVSFFANLVSVLKPLREFGFFMGLCIMIVWLLLTLLFVPLCLVDEYYLGRCYACWHRGTKAAKDTIMQDPCVKMTTKSLRPWLPTGLDSFVKGLQRWRIPSFLLPLALAIGGLVWSVLTVEFDVGVPNIFPREHNQNRGKEVFGLFKDSSSVFPANWHTYTPTSVDVCSQQMFYDVDAVYLARDWAPNNCDYLFWCEADPDELKSEVGTCNCWRKSSPVSQCKGRRTSRVSARFVSHRPLQWTEVQQEVGEYFDSLPGMSFPASGRGSMRSESNFAPLLTEEWERGVKETKVMHEVFAEVQYNDTHPEALCDWEEVCFCDAYACKMPSKEWTKVSEPLSLPQMNDTLQARRLQALGDDTNRNDVSKDEDQGEDQALVPSLSLRGDDRFGRRLRTCPDNTITFQPRVSPSSRTTVDVIFGIEVKGGTSWLGEPDMENAWSFMEMHQVYQPWAQRNLYSFCQELPENLRVVEKRCWIADFKCYIENRGFRFPLQATDFRQTVQRWLQSGDGYALTGLVPSKEYLWIRGDEIKASWFKFRADFSYNSGTSQAIEYQRLWDNYLIQWNMQASIYGKGAWHTSALWVRAEAQSALMWSTIATVGIILVLAWLGMLVFTGDPLLSCLVVLATLGVIFGLVWFIVVLMAWPIGPIEVIALIVFIGYAVTYSLHIAHRYGSFDAESWAEDGLIKGLNVRRYKRTAFAISSIGGAALGSAITTGGCSVFLLFCTLTIFKKLGGVVLAVTVMSIFAALIPLPAGLLLFGPAYPGPLSLSLLLNQDHAAQRRQAREKDRLEAQIRKEEARKQQEEKKLQMTGEKQKKADEAKEAKQKKADEAKEAKQKKADEAKRKKEEKESLKLAKQKKGAEIKAQPKEPALPPPLSKAAVVAAAPTKAAAPATKSAAPATKAAVAAKADVAKAPAAPAKAPGSTGSTGVGMAAPAKAKAKAAVPKAKGASQSLTGVASTPQVKSPFPNAPKAKSKSAASMAAGPTNVGSSMVPPLQLPLTKAPGSISKAPAGSISKAPAGSIIKAPAPMHGAAPPLEEVEEAIPPLSASNHGLSSPSRKLAGEQVPAPRLDVGDEVPLPTVGK